jgi:cell wall-associated NlpC family hydrolase
VRKPLLILTLVGVLAAAGFGVFTIATGGTEGTRAEALATPAAADAAPRSDDYADYPAPRPRVAVAVRPGEQPPPVAGSSAGSGGDAKRSRAASDEEIRAELASFKRALRSGGPGVAGSRAKILPNGDAVAPRGAPRAVKMIIAAGNEIARKPYLWGGGHGAWQDDGYDCSGSVSFALAGAGLLEAPLNSSGFMNWGEEGEGEWVTIYTNPGHMFMVVAGIRFDTSGRGRGSRDSRWQADMRPTGSYTVVHPPGL